MRFVIASIWDSLRDWAVNWVMGRVLLMRTAAS
jgi:hypothetical protein